MGRKHDWELISREYIEGLTGDDGGIYYPTLKELSARHGVSFSYIQRKCAEEKWTEQRKMYSRKVEESRREQKAETLAGEQAKFDSYVLTLARNGLAAVAITLQKIHREYKAGSKVPDEKALERLSKALEQYQKAGRLALGDTTENQGGNSWLDIVQQATETAKGDKGEGK